MSYEIYFINETKKQIVGSKKLFADFEDKEQLLAYLSMCNGDTVRIVGEEDSLIEEEVFGNAGNYKYIRLYTFNINSNRDKESIIELSKEVFNKQTSESI